MCASTLSNCMVALQQSRRHRHRYLANQRTRIIGVCAFSRGTKLGAFCLCPHGDVPRGEKEKSYVNQFLEAPHSVAFGFR